MSFPPGLLGLVLGDIFIEFKSGHYHGVTTTSFECDAVFLASRTQHYYSYPAALALLQKDAAFNFAAAFFASSCRSRALFSELAHEEFDAFRIEELTASMRDRMERLKRASAEELERRRSG